MGVISTSLWVSNKEMTALHRCSRCLRTHAWRTYVAADEHGASPRSAGGNALVRPRGGTPAQQQVR